MASRTSLSEVECTCPVCCDIFTDPVVLLCGHSFCKACLQEWWRQSSSKTCPVCKEVFVMRQPPRNLALRNLSDNLRREKSQRASTDPDLCRLHREKFKLFCVNDQQPICVVCRDSKQHKTHNCEPLSEAAQDHKTKLRRAQMHLRTKEATFKRIKGDCDKIARHIKLQAQQTEKRLKEDFQKMYRFLRAEEASRIDALRTEERQKSQKIKIRIDNLNSEISSISNTLKIIEEQLIAGDAPFMLNFKTTIKRAHDQATLPDPLIPRGTLIDEAKHLGNVQFKVWSKMKGIIQYSPVILDPNTASTYVTISEDLTSVKRSDREQQVPHIPERMTSLYSSVCGSEGISSGTHSWEVEIDMYGDWAAGVTTANGDMWGVYMYHGLELYEMTGNDEKKLSTTLRQAIQKIRVLLDYDQGKLSFYNLKGKTHLHTITHHTSFIEPVVPYLGGNVKILRNVVSFSILFDIEGLFV